MTKEEAKDILHKMSEDNYYGSFVQEACKMAVEALSQKSMTNEDIIYQAIKEVCHVDNPRRFAEHNQTVFEVAKKALELSKPALPSDLDEAAEEYADYNSQRWHEDGDVYYDHNKIMDAFKTGAEWMVGQGVSVDASVVPYDDGLGLNMSDEDILSGIFKDGDKVIVQIRKR